MQRQIIQMAARETSNPDQTAVFAVCTDGTFWGWSLSYGWKQLSSIPQPVPKPVPNSTGSVTIGPWPGSIGG